MGAREPAPRARRVRCPFIDVARAKKYGLGVGPAALPESYFLKRKKAWGKAVLLVTNFEGGLVRTGAVKGTQF